MTDVRDWGVRAADAVAGFTSTRSKGPDAMFGGPGGPTHVVRAHGATVETADGREIPLRADTLCLHGDNPNAEEIAWAVRQALGAAGVEVRALDR